MQKIRKQAKNTRVNMRDLENYPNFWFNKYVSLTKLKHVNLSHQLLYSWLVYLLFIMQSILTSF